MSERPSAVFGWLVAIASGLALAVGGALVALGLAGVAALAATIVGALTACIFFVVELDRIPLTALLLVLLALGSTAGCLSPDPPIGWAGSVRSGMKNDLLCRAFTAVSGSRGLRSGGHLHGAR